MLYQVTTTYITDIIEANTKWEAEAEFLRRHFPTKLDDDLPNLEIDIEEAKQEDYLEAEATGN